MTDPHKFTIGNRIIDRRGKVGTVIEYESAWTIFATVEYDNGMTHRMNEEGLTLYYDMPHQKTL